MSINDLDRLVENFSYTDTTDAWGNTLVPVNQIKPSTGHIISADIDNGMCMIITNATQDKYILRCLHNDETRTNFANTQMEIYVRFVRE